MTYKICASREQNGVPYREKLWQGKKLVNLGNYDNLQSLICQTFFWIKFSHAISLMHEYFNSCDKMLILNFFKHKSKISDDFPKEFPHWVIEQDSTTISN